MFFSFYISVTSPVSPHWDDMKFPCLHIEKEEAWIHIVLLSYAIKSLYISKRLMSIKKNRNLRANRVIV